MDSSERLKAVIEELDSNTNQLAKAIGLPRSQNLYDILNGKANISGTLAAKIIKAYPQFSLGWLVTGEGEMLIKKTNGKELLQQAESIAKENHLKRNGHKEKESNTRRNIYNVFATAGGLVVFNDDPEYIEGYADVPEFGHLEGYVRVAGNSMYPKYCNGDLIACREIKGRDIIPYGEAYLIVTEEYRMIKYIDPYDGDEEKLTIRSEHADFKPFVIKRESILRLYAIKGKITKNMI